MMLSSDISLTTDNVYKPLVDEFSTASGMAKFSTHFAHAWYKLTTRDVGPYERCVGDLVPPAEPWQHPLPPRPPQLPDFTAVRDALTLAINTPSGSLEPDEYNGLPTYGPLFVRLAWQCASTFRGTDYLGGCNGARIRYSPEKDWPINVELDKALLVLAPIKDAFGAALSWADLIVLAGSVALEQAGGKPAIFCGGRTDATDGAASEWLAPKVTGEATDTAAIFKDWIKTFGLTNQEMAVLVGGGHSLGQMHTSRSGFTGAWTSTPTTLDNTYFKNLFEERYEVYEVPSTGKRQYKAAGKELYMLPTDMLFQTDAELAAIAEDYASNNELFLEEFAAAWTKVVNIDRFDGPTGNLCHQRPVAAAATSSQGVAHSEI